MTKWCVFFTTFLFLTSPSLAVSEHSLVGVIDFALKAEKKHGAGGACRKGNDTLYALHGSDCSHPHIAPYVLMMCSTPEFKQSACYKAALRSFNLKDGTAAGEVLGKAAKYFSLHFGQLGGPEKKKICSTYKDHPKGLWRSTARGVCGYK